MPSLNYPFRAVEFFFDALGNPFATNWVPLTREDWIPNDATGFNLEYEALSGSQTWWNLVVQPRGEVFYDPDVDEVPSLNEVLSGGDRLVSMMKIEVEYNAGNGRINRRRMDVGSGFDIFVPPTTQLRARILVPDPDSVPAELPSSVAPRRNIRVAADIFVGASCVDAPVGRDDALYTQPFYTVPATPQAALEAEIQRGAKEAQLFSDIPVAGTAAFIFERTGFDATSMGNFFTASAPGDNTTSDVVIIPQVADILRYTPSNGPAVVTVVQRLKF